MGTTIINLNTDYAAAANIYKEMYAEQNQFSWTKQLALPAIQAAANILILERQKGMYDEIEEKRIGYIDEALGAYKDCIRQVMGKIAEATDDVPEPAMYQPVSPAGEQWETASEQLQMWETLACLAKQVGFSHREMDLARMIALNPKYYQQQEIAWVSIGSLLQGDIPMGLVMREMTRTAENALRTGRLGRAHGQFRRNLGLIDYDIQRAARAERREEIAMQNMHVNPLPRQGDVREFLVSPTQKIAIAIQQAQLLQNAEQNAWNACAKKPPHLINEIQLALQQCHQTMTLIGGKAGLVSGYVPNYAGIFNSQIRDFTNGLFNMFGQSQIPQNNQVITPAPPPPLPPPPITYEK